MHRVPTLNGYIQLAYIIICYAYLFYLFTEIAHRIVPGPLIVARMLDNREQSSKEYDISCFKIM